MPSNKKTSSSSPVKAAVIISVLKVFAYLPLAISQLMTTVIARLLYRLNTNSRKVTAINLKICFPDMTSSEREIITQKSLIASGLWLAETAKIWFRPNLDKLSLIHHVEGIEIIEQLANQSDRGVIIVTPHLGNWEYLFPYLVSKIKTSALYRPPRIAELEPYILAGRESDGGKMIKTSQQGAKEMLRSLNKAECLIILPDQQPLKGSGVFAPFYGHPAYTMTLVQGLVKRTHAELVMTSCIRLAKGFKISFRRLDIDCTLSKEAYATELNSHLEQEISKNPEQYEWAYKRFKARPDGTPDRYR